ERSSAEYANGGRLHKSGPDLGVPERFTPHAFLPRPPDGLSSKDLLTGSHSHGPQSLRSLEGGDISSANGHNKTGIPYISSVARSTDPIRVSIYVPGGRFYHTSDGGESFFIGR